MRKQFFLLAVIQLLLSVIVTAQTHTAKSTVINSNCLGYYEYLPKDYSTSGIKYPLVIYCGGAGTLGNGSATALNKLLAEGIPYYIHRQLFPTSFTVNGEQKTFIVISPQFVTKAQPIDVEAVINFALNNSNYRIDQSRIYIAGFSQGGDATLKYPNTSVARSKRLAAIVPVAAYNYPYVDSGAKYIAAANLPVWALHSTADKVAQYTWSQKLVNKVNTFNPPIRAKLTLFGDIAHDPTKLHVFNPNFRDGGINIYEWMLQYRRPLPPVADAGQNSAVVLPANSTVLDGSGSSHPENLSINYSWTKITGPSKFTINNANNATTTTSNLVAGTYKFELKVTDVNGLFERDTVTVTVENPFDNQMPTADAGSSTTIYLPQTSVQLNGSNSSDAGGSVETYAWQQTGGPSTVFLTSPTTAITSANNFKKGVYTFRLTVTDNEGGTDSDEMQVTVINPFPNVAPVAKAGADQSITLPANSTTIDGSASTDNDGAITAYRWKQVQGANTATISNTNVAQTTVSNLVEGLYLFELTVTDDSSAIGKDTVAITVNQKVNYSTRLLKVNLFGGTNPYNQGGWNNWNVTGSSNITSGSFLFSDGASSAVSAVLSSSQGVSDNGASYGGTMCPAEVLRYTTYTSSNRTVTLRGLDNNLKYDLELYASRASTGNTSIFIINGVSKSVISDHNKSNKAEFTDLVPTNGQLVINISKSGGFNYLNGFILTEKTITTASNALPIADAGQDITTTLPKDSVQLNGSNSMDPDGSIASYQWKKVSGPSSFTIKNPASAITMVTSLAGGVYSFELLVTDMLGAVSKDTVNVVVKGGANLLPVANAGGGTSITLPVNVVSANGNASSDPDGTITAYQWSQVSGPAAVTFDDANVAATQVRGFTTEGLYKLLLMVTDDSSATAQDTLLVTVNPAPPVTRSLKVNLFGGTNPYNQGGWNNWNVTGSSNITSGSFLFSDGASSAVSAVLSSSQGVSDNGASYGGTMCPAEVLRYATYSSSNRTVTLRGLDNNLKYNLELYASRANTGNTTIYTINGVSKSVVSDHNKSNKAEFTDLVPANGQLVINISKTGSFNYLNGFILTEGGPATSSKISGSVSRGVSTTVINPFTIQEEMVVSPNPFRSGLQLHFQKSIKGKGVIAILDMSGKVVKRININGTTPSTLWLPLQDIPGGVYLISAVIDDKTYIQKVLKIQ